jgi:hypothetical protein
MYKFTTNKPGSDKVGPHKCIPLPVIHRLLWPGVKVFAELLKKTTDTNERVQEKAEEGLQGPML